MPLTDSGGTDGGAGAVIAGGRDGGDEGWDEVWDGDGDGGGGGDVVSGYSFGTSRSVLSDWGGVAGWDWGWGEGEEEMHSF